MKNILLVFLFVILFIGCNKEEIIHYDQNRIEIQAKLNDGEDLFDLLDQGNLISSYIGCEYQGGVIGYVSPDRIMVYIVYLDSIPQLQWGCPSTDLYGQTGHAAGLGPSNTEVIVENCSGNTAAYYCKNLVVDSYDDWFLPTSYDLSLFFNNSQFNNLAGNSSDGTSVPYWSSRDHYYSVGSASAYLSGIEGLDKGANLNVLAYRRIDRVTDLQNRINNGETPYDLYQDGIPLSSIYGLYYEGGYVFYMDPNNGQGMVAAPPINIRYREWGCMGSSISGVSTSLGTGNSNTNLISSNCGSNSAAYYCQNLVVGQYSDWYLPSKLEAQKLTNLKNNENYFYPNLYVWTSSQSNSSSAYNVNIYSASSYTDNKSDVMGIIPCRTFY